MNHFIELKKSTITSLKGLSQTYPVGFGAVLICLSTVFFSLMGLQIRLARDVFRADVLVFYRFVLQTLFMLPWLGMYFRRGSGEEGLSFGTKLRFHSLRAFLGACAMTSLYFATQHLSLALASVLSLTSVFWAYFFARIFLKERLTLRAGIWATVACLGMGLCVLGGDQGVWEVTVAGVVAGLLGAAFRGAALTTIKKLRKSVDTREIIFYFGLVGALLLMPAFVLWPQTPQNGWQLWLLLGTGLWGTLGQFTMTAGLRYTSTLVGSLCSLQFTLNSLVIGFYGLGEVPPPFFYVGVVVVMVSLIQSRLFHKK